ncbi:MAG: anti-sigma factor [Xanthobacteraceae bacterium]
MYDDDRDALAAEYVLGTLSADEREQAEALLLIDPGFAEVVRAWEHRLGELNVMVEAVEPPPEIWERVKTDIDGAERRIAAEAEAESEENQAPEIEVTLLPTIEEPAPQTVPEATAEVRPEGAAEPSPQTAADLLATPAEDLDTPLEDADDSAAVAALASSLLSSEPRTDAQLPALTPPATAEVPKIERGADVVYLARRVRRWRSLTVAMSAVAALLAVYVVVTQLAPGLLPAARLRQTAALAPLPASRLVAVLQQEPTAPAFLLTVDPQSRTMTVRRLTSSVDPGRSYQLWLISGKDSKPQSLGLVGGSEFTTRPLPTGFEAAQMRLASYAVSLEPAGGSPSGVPTGPVLFTGKMVESLPTAAAPKS